MHVVTSSVATLNLTPYGATDLTYIAVPVRIAATPSPLATPPSPFLLGPHPNPPPPPMFHPLNEAISECDDSLLAAAASLSIGHDAITQTSSIESIVSSADLSPVSMSQRCHTVTESIISADLTPVPMSQRTVTVNNNICDINTFTSATLTDSSSSTTATIDAIEYIDVRYVYPLCVRYYNSLKYKPL